MARMYTVSFTSVAVTAQQDFFELTAASTVSAVIHWITLTQSTEVGDAQEEGLSLLLRRGVGTTSGSGGSSATPAKLMTGMSSASSTAEVNNTTKMSAGTTTTIHPESWNIRGPFIYLPTPECRPTLAPSERFTVELATTPADSITVSGALYFEEIG